MKRIKDHPELHGLTPGELLTLKEIRRMSRLDLPVAKGMAAAWIAKNRQRRTLRRMALATIRGMYSA